VQTSTKAKISSKSDLGFESTFPHQSGSGCLPDRAKNAVDSFSSASVILPSIVKIGC